MWSLAKQVAFGIVVLSLTISFLVLVLTNYEDPALAKVEPRFFKNDVQARMFELNMLLFLTTFLSASRDTLIFILERTLSGHLSQLMVGICRVCIRMVCISLFDFRVIHIMSTATSLRCSILIADAVSLLLAEAQKSYVSQLHKHT